MSEFARDAYVRKKSGAFWEGVVVGHYSTDQTPDGVAVQLFGWEDGPVQIYPASALEPCDPTAGRLAPQFLTVNLSEDELAELQVAVRNSAPGKIAVATPPPSTHVAGSNLMERLDSTITRNVTLDVAAMSPQMRQRYRAALATTEGKDNG